MNRSLASSIDGSLICRVIVDVALNSSIGRSIDSSILDSSSKGFIDEPTDRSMDSLISIDWLIIDDQFDRPIDCSID